MNFDDRYYPRADADAAIAAAITSANQCIFVLASGGALASSDAGKIVTGYITGSVGFVEVCNPTAQAKALPPGWRLITAVEP